MLSPVFESQEQEVSCLQVEQGVLELQSRETGNAARGFELGTFREGQEYWQR